MSASATQGGHKDKGEEEQTGQKLAATLRWFTAGGAIRIAHYDVINDVITRKL